ncbi:MAG: hypothetical protein AB7J28_11385 [Hyphomonadaceae bacterium]
MISRLKFVLACGLVLGLAACTTAAQAPSDVRRIVSTTSFGMCTGYCTTRLEISEGQAVLIREARGGRGASNNLPEQRFRETLSAGQWAEIASLAANADLSGLPDVIGCPDCADGGAESLTIESSGAPRTVTFEHGATISQAQTLLERVRALRTRLTPE